MFPAQPAGTDAGVVEDEVRCAETLQRGRRQRFDLARLGHVQPERQHLRAQRFDLRQRAVQRFLLHVGHHHLHAALRRDAAGLEAEARSRAGDDGGAALPCRHACSFLIW
jgi:hypothetical protein